MTAVAVDDGVRVDVTLTETPRIVPAIAVAVTDENGASAGPAVKLTSIAGHPNDSRRSPPASAARRSSSSARSRRTLTHRRLWHSAQLSLSDHFNKLDDFDQRSVDLDARVGARLSEEWRAGAIFKYYGVDSDQERHHAVAGQSRHVRELRRRHRVRQPRLVAGAVARAGSRRSMRCGRTGSGEYTTVDIDVRRYSPWRRARPIVATALRDAAVRRGRRRRPDLQRLRARRREHGARPRVRRAGAARTSSSATLEYRVLGRADAQLQRGRAQLLRRPRAGGVRRRRQRLERRPTVSRTASSAATASACVCTFRTST